MKILHIIYCLGGGGAPGAMIAVAKYSSRLGSFQHRVASLLPVDPDALGYAEEAGVSVFVPQDRVELLREIENADIVHVNWWNNPELNEVLRSELPEMRLLIWFHVAGDRVPQIITQELVDFADFALACSPYTYQCPAIMDLPPEQRLEKTGMVYGAADFDRLAGIEPKPHNTFNVGYVGLATPYKMHPNYVSMSASIDVPNVRFIVCGSISDIYEQQAQQLGVAERFDFRGHVSDIKSVFEQFDVFGYPLGIHVAAECGVQEAMYAGVPPVVFPAGGIVKLVINDYTGLVVHSELEYKQAVEYLYHHPEERKRMGHNAREYAKQVFGGENAAKKMNQVYETMMQSPKRKRTRKSEAALTTRKQYEELSGAEKFIESLGNAPEARGFIASMTSQDIQELFQVERKIAESPPFLYWGGSAGGIHHYSQYYPGDRYLRLWAGLVWQQRGEHANAVSDFQSAINLDFQHWRVHWYLAQSVEKAGNMSLAKKSLNTVLQEAPEFTDAQEMSQRIGGIEIGPADEPKRFSTACPHCKEVLYIDRKGRWQCPCCKNDFVV